LILPTKNDACIQKGEGTNYSAGANGAKTEGYQAE